MQKNLLIGYFFVLIALCMASGCGKRNKNPITGKVVINGQTVQEGTLTLTPDIRAKNDGPTARLRIKNGAFKATKKDIVTSGKNVVKVNVGSGTQQDANRSEDDDSEGLAREEPYSTVIDIPAGGSEDLTIEIKTGDE